MAELANALDPSRYEIEIVLTLGTDRLQQIPDHVKVTSLTTAPGPVSAEPAPDRVRNLAGRMPFVRSLATMVFIARMIAALGRRIVQSKPDVILSFLANTNLMCLAAKRWYRFDTPVICSDHVDLSRELERLPWRRSRRMLTRYLYPRAARHIAVSPGAGQDLIDNFHVPAGDVITIINGIDLDRVRALATQPIPGETGGNVFRLVSAGRLNHAKGFDILLRALSLLHSPNWELLLIGDGEEGPRLRALAGELGIDRKVRFLGWQMNPYQWMARCDAYVLSSRWEALPLILLEALALALPIVAGDSSSGAAYALEDGRYGHVVRIDSPADLARAIDDVMASPDLRRKLSALSRERAGAFALSAMVTSYESLFRSVSNAA